MLNEKEIRERAKYYKSLLKEGISLAEIASTHNYKSSKSIKRYIEYAPFKKQQIKDCNA